MEDGRGEVAALADLADDLGTLGFALTEPATAVQLREQRDRLVRLLAGLSRRMDDPDAPLLVVVAGGTGAGKSTTVNTLAGRPVATTGVVRPTTRAPLLVGHPDDLEAFRTDRLLPELARADVEVELTHADADTTTGASGGERARLPGSGTLMLAASDRLPAGLAVLDTPDVDSVEVRNHRLAESALDAADVWLWLATARTYADEAGMVYLRAARRRQALTGVAITQVHDADRDEIVADVDQLLADHDVAPAARLVVPFVPVVDEQVDDAAVAEIREWLAELAEPDARRDVRRYALAGLRAALPAEVEPLVGAARAELATARQLRAAVADAYAPVADRLADELEDGIPVRAEVLRRWRDIVGVGDVAAPVRTVTGQLRSLLGRVAGRGPTPEEAREVEVEVTGAVAELLTRLLEEADRTARWAWEDHPTGRRLLDVADLRRARTDDRAARVRTAVEAWTDHLGTLVDEVAPERHTRARWYSGTLNALATTALLVVFVSTGGLTGAEVGIAAVASAASQTLLVRLFGAQNLRILLAELAQDLQDRTVELVAVDRGPYEQALEAASPDTRRLEAIDRRAAAPHP